MNKSINKVLADQKNLTQNVIQSLEQQFLISSMAWVKRCFSEKSKNLNKLLVFEALYP